MLLSVAAFVAVIACSAAIPQQRTPPLRAHDDGALYLTPMIRDGRVDEARAACRVAMVDDAEPLEEEDAAEAAAVAQGCAGYLTVDDAHFSNMFFWFFPATNGDPDSPVVLWLQGGPGAASLYSVFNEQGPFAVIKDRGLVPRQHSWTATHSLLYVDNPVGAGYSFTSSDAGYCSDQTAVGRNLYVALLQFFALYPEYRNNEFYVAGESYAGKYVPAVSHTIHLNNPNASVKINFKGLAIGNGLIDPINQLVYSEYLYQHGLIDEEGKQKFAVQEDLARNRIAAGDYEAAYHTMAELMITTPSLYDNLTGMRTIYNLMWNSNPIPFEGYWENYVQEPSVRAALHVGKRSWSAVDKVYEQLKYDIPRSVAPWLAELLDSGQYRVLLYSGQLDVIVPFRGTMNVARSLQWSGAERFRNATRSVWRVAVPDSRYNATDVAGYATSSGPLTVLMVRNAGHMVPYDQPAWAHDLIKRFTSGKPFD